MGADTNTADEGAAVAAATSTQETVKDDAPVFLDKGAEEARAALTAAPVEPTADPEVIAALDSPTRNVFQAWVEKCIHNSPMSEHTVSFNYLLSQLPELEAMLNEEGK